MNEEEEEESPHTKQHQQQSAIIDKNNLDSTLVYTFSDHEGSVRGCAFSPDARTLATVSNDRTARIYDVVKGKPVENAVLRGHTDAVVGVAFSPNRPILATSSADSTVILWDTNTWEEIRTLRPKIVGTIRQVKFSPDGLWIATASDDHTCELWDLESGKNVGSFEHIDYVLGCAFSPNGSYLASASRDKTCKVWDLTTLELKCTLTGHTGFVWSCVFSDDESSILTASADKSCKLWDIATGLCTKTFFGHSNEVNCVVYAPSSSLVITASDDGTTRLWDYVTGKELCVVRGHKERVHGCDFTNSSGLLATCSEDGTANIYAVNTLMVPICKLSGPTVNCDTRDEVVIRANVSGQPPPQLSWYVIFLSVSSLSLPLSAFEQQQKQQNTLNRRYKDDVLLSKESGNEIVVPCADTWHTGVYRCVAINQCGKSEDSYTIQVESRGSIVDRRAKNLEKNRDETRDTLLKIQKEEKLSSDLSRELQSVQKKSRDVSSDLERALKQLEEIQRLVDRLRQEKDEAQSRIEQLQEHREKTVTSLAEARDRAENLQRDRVRQEKQYRDAVQRETNAKQALQYCQSVSQDDERSLPIVIQTALNFPEVLSVQTLACERLRDKLVCEPDVYSVLPRPQTTDFLDAISKRFPISLGSTVDEIKLFIDRVCPEIVSSIHDVDAGRLVSVTLEDDFVRYHGTKTYFDICDMAIRAALPLMETYDSAVTKAVRDDVAKMLKRLEDRDLLTSTVQRMSRLQAIFRQFDQINQATPKGDTMAILAALKGDGIREVAVSTVHHAVMTVAQNTFAVEACRSSKNISLALEAATLALRLASGKRLDRLALSAVNMYSVASFLRDSQFLAMFPTVINQNVQTPEMLRTVLDVETLMAPPFLLNRSDAQRFVSQVMSWTPPVNVSNLPLWRNSMVGSVSSSKKNISSTRTYYDTAETKKNVSKSSSSSSNSGHEFVLGWKPAKVLDWLGSIGLSKYGAVFAEHQIDGPLLLSLKESDLRMVGITDIRERNLLLRKIALAKSGRV